MRIPIRLQWKFLIAIMAVVTLFGGIHIFLIKMFLEKTLKEELQFQLNTIASGTSRSLVPYLLVDDIVAMNKLLLKAREADQRIGYAFILDPSGAFVVHTFGTREIPIDLFIANRLTSALGANFKRIQDLNRPSRTYLDIAYPLGDRGRYGTLRMGVDEKGIRATLNRIVMTFMFMVLVFSFLGVMGAFVTSRWINRPIKRIECALDEFDLHASVPAINVTTGDELENFAQHIESMMKRLKATHRKLEDARTKMFKAERVATIGTLAAGIAHEVRNPLAGMLNSFDVLSKEPEAKRDLDRYLPLLVEAANRIDATITRFLNFARFPKVEGGAIQINKAVESAVVLARSRVGESDVRLHVDLKKNIPAVQGEEHLIQQVVLNILINAIDAVGEEGYITVRTSLNKEVVFIEIRDNGMGIEEKDLEHLFDPFYSTKGEGGTGLGLAISMEIVKQFQGKIHVDSQPGVGTTFRVEIPIGER